MTTGKTFNFSYIDDIDAVFDMENVTVEFDDIHEVEFLSSGFKSPWQALPQKQKTSNGPANEFFLLATGEYPAVICFQVWPQGPALGRTIAVVRSIHNGWDRGYNYTPDEARRVWRHYIDLKGARQVWQRYDEKD